MKFAYKKTIHTLNQKLKHKIFGQDEIIDEVSDILKINSVGLGDENKPIASFLFKGSTGVGKTELAIEIANELNLNYKRFDMSEYSSQNSIKNLIGGDAGLVGYEEGGALTNFVKNNPKSVLLFDEMEKADKSIMNTFLQVLDYGQLTSTKGESVSFKDTVIIFTSNLGAIQIKRRNLGFNSITTVKSENDIDTFLSPEFIARLDSICSFNPLSKDMVSKITDKFLLELSNKLRKLNLSLTIDESVKKDIIDKSLDLNLGARGVSKIIRNDLKIKIADEIIRDNLNYGDNVHIQLDEIESTYSITISKQLQQTQSNDEIFFETALDAQNYAKENPLISITRAPYGNGYVVKK